MSALTKSSYLAGQQCERRLWLARHAPEAAPPPHSERLLLQDVGREVGVRARELFPGGVLVSEADPAAAAARTRALLDDPTVPAIFEAALEADHVRIRIDVLERMGATLGLREIKASTVVKEEHLDDVALQLHVAQQAGLEISSVEVIVLDPTYTCPSAGADLAKVFARRDVMDDATLLAGDVAARVAELRTVAAGPDPMIEPSPHCRRPRLCAFFAHCTRAKPADWIYRLPQLRSADFHALLEQGVRRIPEIPDDYPLQPHQKRARSAHREEREAVSDDLATHLAGTGPPSAYLDFETWSPPIPIYPGMGPFQPIAFQWSLHRIDAAGAEDHTGFLPKQPGDPRRAFAQTLLEAIESDGVPIHVYSGYEDAVIAELAEAFPDLTERLTALRHRLVDLLPIVRDTIYAPGFQGSFSMKQVAPALVPGFSYSDLDGVAEGAGAARAIHSLIEGAPSEAEAARLLASLEAYCRRDTEGLMVLHRALRERAGLD